MRDLRLRWACEEAGLPYNVQTIPFEDRETNHLMLQPFGQVPFMSDGELQLFESGACLLYLAQKTEKLMPRCAIEQAHTNQWIFSALNSIEIVSVPWWFLNISGNAENDLTKWLSNRLDQLEAILSERDWLVADTFTVADLLMADVLRVPSVRAYGNRPATEAYIIRTTDRPAFKKAYADQMVHFELADASRA
ncbi:glutathione S-transferase family protein [Gilvimarinus agarilyticus]|uniref:glutathione S-transferase family protein n=1 Tax=Gilvimarinus sp. 2_MG-2023 TaxID=3062666 RepID=UPI001C08450F|nr:glutathione S-transferase family protein [Gilvimarinus sp. 2_MG-2023]MBU2885613.1 glutathione S-transferase family protein [Gilvimarinus agarilyticus]MDO6570479.1 glutathione S-transferase family protein [Gilvimarinus sp. 2_MG-2023]